MAEYRVEFTADSSAAERSIKALKREIKGVTKEFEGAEIGAAEFLEAASDLSGLQKELKDARSAVVDIDGAYKKLSQTMAQFRSGMGARGAIPSVASPIRGTAQQFGSPEYFDALNRNLEKAIKEGRQLDAEIEQAANSRQQAIANFRAGMGAKDASWVASSVQGTPQQLGSPAYFDALNKSLKRAIDEGRQLDAEIQRAADSREQAITAFRSGMGARGAIPAIASPIRGGMEYGPAYGSAGSPAYLEEVAKAAKKAQQELDDAAKAAGTIAPQAKAFNPASLAAFETKLKLLKKEARLIAPDSTKWKALTKEILQAERSIKKINQRQRLGPSVGQRAGAAGGAFLYGGGMGGGIGSALGGVAGGAIGGVPGAFAGAAVGQIADNLGTALAGITSQAAAVQKMQRGLAMASVDAKDFAEAQAAVGEMSQKLLMPLEQTAKYFTQLRANTKEYNFSIAETRQILEGTALAIMATGGSAEDLDGAMRAVVQIMSKGGVQAEELRGQLGERFPGAVVKFAQANKMSFEELQAGLEAGQIGIRQFIEFAKKNYTDYAKFSEQLATAPEYAGQRLKIAFEEMQLAIGQSFGASGATIQDTVADWIKDITAFVTENREYLQQMASDFAYIFKGIVFIVKGAAALIRGALMPVVKFIQGLIRDIRIAVNSAGAAQYKSKISSIDAEIATAEKTGDVRAAGRIATLRKNRAEMDKLFRGAGGEAALSGEGFTYGGAGAGMSIDREEKENKTKTNNLEAFERLRDQLANAYNKAEIERIKAAYELRKRLQEDLYDMQEFGANRLQKQNIQFLRALAKAEQDRQDVAFNGQLEIAETAGRVAPSAPVLPPASGGPIASSGYIDKKILREWLVSQGFGRTTGDFTNKGHATPSHTLNAMDMGILGGSDADALRKTIAMERKLQATGAFGNQLFGPERDPYGHGAGKGGQNIHLHIPTPGGKVPLTPGLASLMNNSGAVSAGASRTKVGANEIRDTMTRANTGIAQDNAALADRNAITTRSSDILKSLSRYMQEIYNVPDLTLDNQLLKERNDLIEQGVNENVIDYRMRLREMEIQYQDLLKRFPAFAEEANLKETERIRTLADLKIGIEAVTEAEKNKNDETERGTYIRARTQIANELAMAQAFTPDQEMRAQIAQEGFTGAQADTIFQERKTLQGAEKLKADMQGIAGAIGDSFGNAFKGVITGSMTAQEALAGFFQSVADSFADMAAKIIAEYLKMALIKGIMSLLPGLAPGAGLSDLSAPATINNPLGDLTNIGGQYQFANGGIAAGGFTAFANGGIVTGPTLGLVGEGRYNEAVIPLPDGKSVPVDLGGAMGSQITSNIVVNVSSDGKTSSSGAGSDSAGLGRKIEGAVKQVIVGELRPGGLLAGRR